MHKNIMKTIITLTILIAGTHAQTINIPGIEKDIPLSTVENTLYKSLNIASLTFVSSAVMNGITVPYAIKAAEKDAYEGVSRSRRFLNPNLFGSEIAHAVYIRAYQEVLELSFLRQKVADLLYNGDLNRLGPPETSFLYLYDELVRDRGYMRRAMYQNLAHSFASFFLAIPIYTYLSLLWEK